MTSTVVDSLGNDQALAWLSLDPLVVGQTRPPEIDPVVLDMSQPARSVPSLHGDTRPNRRPGGLVARWVSDPHGETGLICTWVPRTLTETSETFDA